MKVTNKELLEKIRELIKEKPHSVFCGYHQSFGDRQVLEFEDGNPVCLAIGLDDYMSNLYLEDEKGNLNVIWTYKDGWKKLGVKK